MRGMLKRVKISMLESVYRKPVQIQLPEALISFTFDDAPLSAATTGATILEQVGARGTFYISTGMMGGLENQDRIVDAADLLRLRDAGHDIQCHTKSHLNLRITSASEVDVDCEANRDTLHKILGERVTHFSYPFGMVSLGGKRRLRQHYDTLRTVDHGVNAGLCDFSHLRSVDLYSQSMQRNRVENFLRDAVGCNGWLIFYTHDVRETPSSWGITPDDLSWVVDLVVKQKGLKVATVSEAFDKITGK